MGSQITAAMRRKLDEMERSGAVDMSILGIIARARAAADRIKAKWIGIDDTDGFYFYQGAASADLVLSQMEKRFKKSQDAGDNPKIASDSLRVIPLIDRALDAAQADAINKRTIDRVLRSSRDLMDCAIRSGLMMSLEESQRSVNSDLLGRHLGSLMRNLNVGK